MSSQIVSDTQQLIKTFDSGDYLKAYELLPKLKVAFTKAGLIIPRPEASKDDLLATRTVLEIGALSSIHIKQDVEFDRYYSQLKPFYALNATLGKSTNENRLIGLHLLLLLSRNDIAEFHTILETLDTSGNDPYIQYPIQLEQWLMEGSYDRVYRATSQKSEVPALEFSVFSDILIDSIRNEVASCSEKAYLSLPLSNARHLLFLSSDRDVVEFVKSRGWVIKNGRITFPTESNLEESKLAADALIENVLDYAKEIETIV